MTRPTMTRFGRKRWTEDDDRIALLMDEQNRTYADIARVVGKPIEGVKRRLYRLGRKKPRSNPIMPLTEEQATKAKELLAEGCRKKDVAYILEVEYRQVIAHFRKERQKKLSTTEQELSTKGDAEKPGDTPDHAELSTKEAGLSTTEIHESLLGSICRFVDNAVTESVARNDCIQPYEVIDELERTAGRIRRYMYARLVYLLARKE